MKENAQPINILDTEWRNLVDPYKETAFEKLRELIAINSVLDLSTKTEAKPFGEGVDKALEYVARLGESLGFSVDRCDGYVTELTYGEGDKIFDIYAHVDVVPVNEKNWTNSPFELVISEGNTMYGRGTSDDKGPGIACLYAVKALMDNGYLGGYKMRFLFGGNEENDSLCLEHYFKTLKRCYPTYGISPDAEYPLIYGEKSIYAYKADYKLSLPQVKSFHLGSALNIVLQEASAEVEESVKMSAALLEYLSKHPEVEGSVDGNKVTFIGVPCHGSTPWNGVNAGLHLLNFLGTLFCNKELCTIYDNYADGKGNAFGGNFNDKDFSETSYNVGRISYDGSTLSLFVNLRFPAGLDYNVVTENVKTKTGAEITVLGGSDGFVSDPKSDFIQILLRAYQEETGDYESKPLAIGGGTYARESKNSVAYGAQFPGRDYRMHGDDEFFPLTDFFDNMQIYAHAIANISEYLRELK